MNSTDRPNIAPGLYRHYKGKDYQVIDLARHSETEEWLVIYRPLYDPSALWARPADMFTENVQSAQGKVPRFRYLGEV